MSKPVNDKANENPGGAFPGQSMTVCAYDANLTCNSTCSNCPATRALAGLGASQSLSGDPSGGVPALPTRLRRVMGRGALAAGAGIQK